MRRHFKVTTTRTPATGVDVMLFFSDEEYQDLKADAWANNPGGNYNPNYCEVHDDVYNFNQLYVTKYSGPNEDDSYLNNAQVPTGLYRVYGDNTTPYLPLTKGEYTGQAGTGFRGIYGGSNTHHYLQLRVNEFSEFWIHGSQQGQALPVEMIYLQAEAMDNAYLKLSWATAIEINNRGFEVQRSIDGQNWATLGWVNGNNNTTVQSNYSFNDMNVLAGMVYYYRLKQVDNDEAYEFTDIVSAKLKGDVTFSVFDFMPNPASEKTSLLLTSSRQQEVTVAFYNIVGQRVVESVHDLSKGNNLLDFQTADFASGTYTAVITSGNESYTRKVVIQK
jgi:hypothetical protein